MDTFRSVYVMAKEAAFGRWVRRFWRGRSPRSDPLWHLLHPRDSRGEVTAWGDSPHWTVTDALTVVDPEAFGRIVKGVCRLCPRPTLEPKGLRLLPGGPVLGTSLVVSCRAPALEPIRRVVLDATSHLVARQPLADEEFQRAEWWVRQVGKAVKANLAALWDAREQYLAAGAPPLPSSRHFRLGFLVRLCKALRNAATADERKSCERRVGYFLSRGEPPWYASTGSLHVTLASGLSVRCTAKQRVLDRFSKLLWPSVLEKLTAYQPEGLAIMGEYPEHAVKVHFHDFLTETLVPETRPGFKVLEWAPFEP